VTSAGFIGFLESHPNRAGSPETVTAAMIMVAWSVDEVVEPFEAVRCG
jgi:hypothetical protein